MDLDSNPTEGGFYPCLYSTILEKDTMTPIYSVKNSHSGWKSPNMSQRLLSNCQTLRWTFLEWIHLLYKEQIPLNIVPHEFCGICGKCTFHQFINTTVENNFPQIIWKTGFPYSVSRCIDGMSFSMNSVEN